MSIPIGHTTTHLLQSIQSPCFSLLLLPRGSPRRADLDDELELLKEMLKDERSDTTLELAEAKARLAAYRKDKREFLIDAINTRFHGRDWRNQ